LIGGLLVIGDHGDTDELVSRQGWAD